MRGSTAHAGVVCAHHRRAVEGHAVQEVHERAVQPLHRVAVGVHVVGVDIGHDREHGAQVQEEASLSVRLDHDELALAQARVGARSVQLAADHEGGVQARLDEDGGDEDAVVVLPWVPAMAMPARRRISSASITARATTGMMRRARPAPRGCRPSRRCSSPAPGLADVLGRVPDLDAQAQLAQAQRGGALGRVRAADRKAQVVQDLGNAAHAGAADAHEVNALHCMFHFNIPSIHPPRAAARGRASAGLVAHQRKLWAALFVQ